MFTNDSIYLIKIQYYYLFIIYKILIWKCIHINIFLNVMYSCDAKLNFEIKWQYTTMCLKMQRDFCRHKVSLRNAEYWWLNDMIHKVSFQSSKLNHLNILIANQIIMLSNDMKRLQSPHYFIHKTLYCLQHLLNRCLTKDIYRCTKIHKHTYEKSSKSKEISKGIWVIIKLNLKVFGML